MTKKQIEDKKLKKVNRSFKIGNHNYKPQDPVVINEIINKLNELTEEVYK